MEQLIAKIVEIENRAQHMVDSASKRRELMNDEIISEGDAIKAKYREMASRRLLLVEEQENSEQLKDAEKLRSDYTQRLSTLNEMFESRKSEWIERIYADIIGAILPSSAQ